MKINLGHEWRIVCSKKPKNHRVYWDVNIKFDESQIKLRLIKRLDNKIRLLSNYSDNVYLLLMTLISKFLCSQRNKNVI